MSEPFLWTGAPEPGQGQHAVFAARLRHWPFNRLAEQVWVDRDDEFKIQFQLLERQLRFLTALHPGEAGLSGGRRLAVDLRYLGRPGAARVEAVLLGKAYDPSTAEAAQAAARALWETFTTALPIGYELVPAETEADFREWSGADLVEQAVEQRRCAEVRRPAEFLFWTDETQPRRFLPIVYPFRWEPSGWDIVWAALTRVTEPTLVSVNLQPVSVSPEDERILSDLCFDLAKLAREARPPLSARAAEAADWFDGYLQGLRTAYTARLMVVGAPAVRAVVRGAVGGPYWSVDAYSTSGSRLQAEVVEPTEAERPLVQDNLTYLEQAAWGPNPWGAARLLPIFDRLRYLVDPAGALCAFRLPLLPPGDLPGVILGEEIDLGSQP